MPDRSCRRCSNPKYEAVLRSVAAGLPKRSAAQAADIHYVNVHRHRQSCPEFSSRLKQAEIEGRGAGKAAKQSQQGSDKATASSADRQRATPIIAAAVAAGATRTEAAERAGINPSTERTWYRNRADYRAAIEQAQAGAKTGASQ